MDTQEQIRAMSETISLLGGQTDALLAALTGILKVTKAHPEVAELVGVKLEKHYADHLGNSQNEYFMRGFELARDLINDASK